MRGEVPEFEPIFGEELELEEGEMGAFQAVSLLADWTSRAISDSSMRDVVQRVFATVESWITDGRFPLGDALAAEFIEGICRAGGAKEFMGPRTRERASSR